MVQDFILYMFLEFIWYIKVIKEYPEEIYWKV